MKPKKKSRNLIALAHSLRKGAGAGPHTSKKYTRNNKHKNKQDA